MSTQFVRLELSEKALPKLHDLNKQTNKQMGLPCRTVELALEWYEDVMVLLVSIFIFCLER